MISITCDNCETVLTTGVGRFVIDKGATTFYCKDCEEKLVLSALKAGKPGKPTVRRTPKSNGTVEVATAN
jgi:hypothetical protein